MAEGTGGAEDRIPQRLDLADRGRVRERDAEGLGGAGGAGIGDVQSVQARILADVGRDDGLAAEIDVVEVVGHAEEVVEIQQRRWPVLAAQRIDAAHGFSGSREVDPAAAGGQRARRVAAVVGDLAGGSGDQVLDQRARKAQAPVGVQVRAACARQALDLVGDGADADARQDLEGCIGDAQDVLRRQRLVQAAGQARVHRQGAPLRAVLGDTGGPALSGSVGSLCGCVHVPGLAGTGARDCA